MLNLPSDFFDVPVILSHYLIDDPEPQNDNVEKSEDERVRPTRRVKQCAHEKETQHGAEEEENVNEDPGI